MSSQQEFANFETSLGNFKIKLYSEWSPKAVSNFTGLAEGTKEFTDPKTQQKTSRPYYNGLVFHRIIDGFMIQGGCPVGNGMGGPGYKFENEDHPMAKHSKPGILAMANAGRNTNGSQFYITVAPQPRLDGGYTVFGEVIEGMDVVYKIGQVKTGPMDRPLEPVVIKSVTIVRQ